jgi:DNA-binding MarR family transcriptional regulator
MGVKNMENFRSVSALMERIIHKYSQIERKRCICVGDLFLTRAEIHTVEAVGNQSGLNITTLAEKLGITKGAASQMIYKLVDKGLVQKSVSPDSDTEVCLTLTDIGKTAFESHREYHKEHDRRFYEHVEGMPKEVFQYMITLMEDFESELDKKLKK